MRIPPRVVADLAALTKTFDDPDVDLLRSLRQFADQVRLAVPSCVGISMSLTSAQSRVELEAMDDDLDRKRICSSLAIPAAAVRGRKTEAGPDRWDAEVIIYASAPGSLVDLAADLGWLTTLGWPTFALDQHLAGPPVGMDGLPVMSVINQAIGVLIGRGRTSAQATVDLDLRAAATGTSRWAVATSILAGLSGVSVHPGPDAIDDGDASV